MVAPGRQEPEQADCPPLSVKFWCYPKCHDLNYWHYL